MGRSVGRSVVLAAALGAACGGNDRSPTAPSRPAPPPTGLGAGTVVTVVSGDTAAPLPGVSLTVAGQPIVTDGGGQARLPTAAPLGTLVDLTHPAHLDRQTTIRTATGERFTLWPRATADGLDENYTATLAYTQASDTPPPVGTSPLYRLPVGTDTVVVVPSADLLADGAAVEAHQAAAASATEATGGRVRFLLSASTPPAGTGVVITSRVDPTDAICTARGVRGFMRGSYRSFEIVGGQIVFCEAVIARTPTVAHELGHAFGLQHGPDARDVMSPNFSNRRAAGFGPREWVVMRLMLDRLPGNRFPDSDRGIAASSAVEERLTVCR